MKKLIVFVFIFILLLLNPYNAKALDLPIRIDFDNSDNKTMTNYIGFQPLVYDAARGYGWSGTVSAYRYGSYDFKNLTNDNHYANQDRTFIVDVPNGEYTVKLYFQGAAWGTYADNIQVTAEGIFVLDNVNSTKYPNIKIFDIIVSDNQLNILFHDNGGTNNIWLVNGIEIYPRITRPGITNAAYIDSKSVQIEGINFGNKNHPNPLKWDNFENGQDGHPMTEFSDWRVLAGSDDNIPRYLAGERNRKGSALCSEHKMWPGNSRMKYWTGEDTKKIYVSFWTVFNFGREIVDTNTSYQVKFWRLDASNYNTTWMVDPSIITSNWKYDYGLPTEYNNHYITLRRTDSSTCSDYYTPPLEQDVWFRIEMQVEQSDINVANGGYSAWHSQSSGSIINIISDWDQITRIDAGKYESLSLGDWLGDLTSGKTETYFDDVYFDNSWARVEVGDKATFEECTHREIQIPTTWVDNLITMTFNQGSFNNGDTVYLYVVDENGNMNVNGFPITIGGAITPPEEIKGDLNSDGKIDITDIQACVNHILGAQDYGAKADVNQDGSVNVMDVQEIVNVILGS